MHLGNLTRFVYVVYTLVLLARPPALAQEGLLEGLNNGPQTAPSSPDDMAAAATPLAKFSAVGRVTFATVNLPCGRLPLCNSCTFVILSGPVQTTGAPGLGKSALSACLSLDNNTMASNGSGGGSCENTSGSGTITGANGNAINIILGGQACAVQSPIPSTKNPFVTLNTAYAVTGGTGKLSNAIGQGNFTNSVTVIPGGFTNSAVTLTGSLAAH